MIVRDIMTSEVLSVDQNESVSKAAQIMRDANVGSVPVKSGEQVVGIITDRDIVLRNVADKNDPGNTKCGDVMSQELISCTPDMDVQAVADLMAKNQIRRIPVVENETIIGMVSLGDLAVENRWEEEAGEALSNISEP